MPSEDELIVPVITPSSSIHFANVGRNGTVQDVIAFLLSSEEILSDIAGDIEHPNAHGWALQLVRHEESGRLWEETELDALGDGILNPSTPVTPLLQTTPSSPRSARSRRHLSTFPLTSHLHSPKLRLVSLHPYLSTTLTFLRVPEIYDGFQWKCYFSRSSTAADVLKRAERELGLTTAIPTMGVGLVEYVLEQVWSHRGKEVSSAMSPETLLYTTLADPQHDSNPFQSRSASRSFRIVVPEDWYRRPSSSSSSSHIRPVRRPSVTSVMDHPVNEEEDDGEGTAKQKENPTPSEPSTPLSPRLLSSVFDSWRFGIPSTSASPSRSSRIISVSEPQVIDTIGSVLSRSSSHTRNASHSSSASDTDTHAKRGTEEDEEEFERMLDDLGLKDAQRNALYNLPADRRRYLLEQHRLQEQSNIRSVTPPRSSQESTGPSTPERRVTGDSGIGLMKRFSLSAWGLGLGSESSPPSSLNNEMNVTSVGSVPPSAPALVSQSTGGSLWSSWWTSSGGTPSSSNASSSNATSSSNSSDILSYISPLLSMRTTDPKLAKHLMSLRVHLSTAKLSWVEGFVRDGGVEALGSLLRGGKGKETMNDIEQVVVLEVVKCLRSLLNTEPGFNYSLSSPAIIHRVVFTLYSASSNVKLQTLVCEVLAALIVLAPLEGHKHVLSAFSDAKVIFDEEWRFDGLLRPLRVGIHTDDTGESDGKAGLWEAQTATLVLINALANYPASLEERMFLREEFGRRGLHEAIAALRYLKPPDSLVAQLDLYIEEKQEDEEDLRDRLYTAFRLQNRAHQREGSDSETILRDLISLSKQQGKLHPVMLEILKGYTTILEKSIDLQVKTDMFYVLDKFVDHAARLEDFGDSWRTFAKHFASSVEHITGSLHPNDDVYQDELEALQAKVENLNDEKLDLRQELDNYLAELNTLKDLHPFLASDGSKTIGKGVATPQNFQGIVQRLVRKEKQVLQLQNELSRVTSQTHVPNLDTDEKAKRERDKLKIQNLAEEVNKLKVSICQQQLDLEYKEKEILYFKRALESVYSRSRNAPQISSAVELDAQQMANESILNLTEKEKQIEALYAEIKSLNTLLSVTTTSKSTEAEYEKPVPPLSPPPVPSKFTKPSILKKPTINIPILPPSSPAPVHAIHDSASNRISPRSPSPPILDILPPPPPPPPPPPTPPRINEDTIPPPPPPPPPPLPSTNGTVVPLPPPPPSGGPIFHPISKRKPNQAKQGPRLKPFFWTKLSPGDARSTVWADGFGSDLAPDMHDFEDTFSLTATSTPDKAVKPTALKKARVSTLLDITRANHIAIMLRRIKLDFPSIRKAIIGVDDINLSIDDLKAIFKQLPTAEEISRLMDYKDPKQLAPADQYFYEIMTIPQLSARLESMIFKVRLVQELEETRPELNTLRMVAVELKQSGRFKRILQIVLMLGNKLNSSTFRGSATGFRLEALAKLKETRTAQIGADCPTLLHYLTKILIRSDNTLICFQDEIPHLEEAARLSTQAVFTAVQNLDAGLAQVNRTVHMFKGSQCPPEDCFVAVMEPFLKEARSQVEALSQMSSSVDNTLKSLLLYFGETLDGPDAMKPEDFFGLIMSFSSDLQKTALELKEKLPKDPPHRTSIVTPLPQFAASKAHKPLVLTTSSTEPRPDRTVGRRTIVRGQLDQTIRTLKEGHRTARSNRPLSKIFLDA